MAQGPSHLASHGILPDQELNALAGGFPTTGPPGKSNHICIHVLENLLWVEPRLTRAGKSGDKKALCWTWHGDPGSDMEDQEGEYAKEDPSFLAWATGCP